MLGCRERAQRSGKPSAAESRAQRKVECSGKPSAAEMGGGWGCLPPSTTQVIFTPQKSRQKLARSPVSPLPAQIKQKAVRARVPLPEPGEKGRGSELKGEGNRECLGEDRLGRDSVDEFFLSGGNGLGEAALDCVPR